MSASEILDAVQVLEEAEYGEGNIDAELVDYFVNLFIFHLWLRFGCLPNRLIDVGGS